MKNAVLACLCISLCDDFDFPLFATIATIIDDVRIHILIIYLRTFSVKKT